MNWINVNKELPNTDIDVLCVFTGWDDMIFQRVLCYDDIEKHWYDWNGTPHDNITHWMPLPEPPSVG